MSSIFPPNVLTYKATAAIPKGSVVKIGADREHVSKAAAATDKSVGIAQTANVLLAEDKVEVAHAGGGAKGLAGGTIAAGDLLTSDANGALVVASTGNRVVGHALESAVVGDLFAMFVSIGSL